jgi:CHAT domain-containing protein
MVTFIKKAQQMPPDKALQEAMRATRDKHKDPALWAGFSVFGTPLR